MSDSSRKTVVTAIGAHNLLQNLLLPSPAYVPANLMATCGLVALARRYGCSWKDLGLDPSRAASGLRLGLAATAIAGALANAAVSHPASRRYLLDQRAQGQEGRELAYRALVRFPLGTALFEEVAFRGVVVAVWRRSGASRSEAALAAAATFGLWHLIPVTRDLAGNPLASRLESSRSRAGAVASGAILTGLASLGLSWMRERSGSLIAPWLTHASFLGAGYLAGVAMWRRRGSNGP